MSIRSVAPVGWDITASCHGCGHMTRCWADGTDWFCRSCFRAEHGFDPRTDQWEPIGA